MHLSPHFTLQEMTKSQYALRHGIDNSPGPGEIAALRHLANGILEPVRAHFDQPLSPSSAFRCSTLNTALGSADSSQHILGEAADFELPGIANVRLARWIAESLEFDQLILEYFDAGIAGSGWVHCSLRKRDNRSEVLTLGPPASPGACRPAVSANRAQGRPNVNSRKALRPPGGGCCRRGWQNPRPVVHI